MSLLKTFFVFFISIFVISCNSPKSFTGETVYAGASEKGTLLVSASGYGQSKILAIENAEINALKNILYKGIPGSPYSKPIIEDAAKAESGHSAYFDNLFQKGGHKVFLMTSTVISDFKLLANRRSNITVKIKYDVNAIRVDLEKNGVIRKFGF